MMAKKIRNIRIEDSIWKQAKASAALSGLTLQSWLTCAILKMSSEGRVEREQQGQRVDSE